MTSGIIIIVFLLMIGALGFYVASHGEDDTPHHKLKPKK